MNKHHVGTLTSLAFALGLSLASLSSYAEDQNCSSGGSGGSSASTCTIFFDNFDRNSSNTVGNGWTEYQNASNDVAIGSGALMLRDNNPLAAAAQMSLNGLAYDQVSVSFDWKGRESGTGTNWLGIFYATNLQLTNWVTVRTQSFAGGTSWANWSAALPLASGVNPFAIKLQIGGSGTLDNTDYVYIDNFCVTGVPITASVPEPESYAMLLSGLGMMGFLHRRKRQAQHQVKPHGFV